MTSSNKILIELSGGLDSSVAASLLQNQGYDVVGAIMHLHDSAIFNEDLATAEEVANKLNIGLEVIDFREEFNHEVVQYFVDTYNEAKTPNPCIICNMEFKFGRIFDVAEKLGCDKIATGHYARTKNEDGLWRLYMAKDKNKDQSYVLHFLAQEQLSKIIFPLGDYTKDEVREMAKAEGLPCADKEESMDLCFTEGKTYNDYLVENCSYKGKPGSVVDNEGNVLGQHEGLINYTIGQRKGLGIAGGDPLYVLSLNKERNEVVLGPKDQTFVDVVCVSNFSWIAGKAPADSFSCQAKLRYRQTPHDCVAEVDGDTAMLIYQGGIDAVTPGQFAVLYDGEKVLGGGTIC